MSFIKNLANKLAETKKIHNTNLYYGYIGETKTEKEIINGKEIITHPYHTDTNKGFVIMQKLNSRERNKYLKQRYNTFLDGENNQMLLYLAIKYSNIEYYRVLSMNDMIIPCYTTTDEASLIGDCISTLSTCPLSCDFNIIDLNQQYLTLSQINEYESMLNLHQQQTYYHDENRNLDYDFREYYQW